MNQKKFEKWLQSGTLLKTDYSQDLKELCEKYNLVVGYISETTANLSGHHFPGRVTVSRKGEKPFIDVENGMMYHKQAYDELLQWEELGLLI